MTTVPLPRQRTSAPEHDRWRMSRAGIVNVWFYYDQRFDLSGGRLVLRGSNGSGKSRALEMLLPFVLDADRRRMDATGSGKVRLEDLMRAGGEGQPNRLGYVWLELARTTGTDAAVEYLTVGALVRYSHSTEEAKAWYFLTPLRVDDDLTLMDPGRIPLSREGLIEAIGADRLTASPETHRDRVRAAVFGLHGDQGRERFDGLLQLLHTLRSPDVGNRIDEGRLPQILSDALPPLSESAIARAGEELDGLEEMRAALGRLETSYNHVADFLKVYARYTTGVLCEAADDALTAALTSQQADHTAAERAAEHERLTGEHAAKQAQEEELQGLCEELRATTIGIRESTQYKAARELGERDKTVQALASAANSALEAAAFVRREEDRAARASNQVAGDLQTHAQGTQDLAHRATALLKQAGLDTPVPARLAIRLGKPPAVTEPVRTAPESDPEPHTRPMMLRVELAAVDAQAAVEETGRAAGAARAAASTRAQQAEVRGRDARRLRSEHEQVMRQRDRAEDCAASAAQSEERALTAAGERDDEAVALALAWREWAGAPETAHLLGDVDWAATPVGEALETLEAWAGEADDARGAEEQLARLDATASQAAFPARTRHARQVSALQAEAEADADLRRDLLREAKALQQEHDPAPPGPPWLNQVVDGAVPLWRVLEFVPGTDAQTQAGVEAALLASGLLHASFTAEGDVVALDGQLLIRAQGPTVLESLRRVLRPADDCGVPHQQIEAVLHRIALSPGHSTWVSPDGSWGNGPLTGCHQLPCARFIGAAARAVARAARLAEIEQHLAQLAQAAQVRSEKQERLDSSLRRLEEHLLLAPPSARLATLRLRASSARQDASALLREAEQMRVKVEEAEREWSARQHSHREVCAALGLPDDPVGLEAVQSAAGFAEHACAELERSSEALGRLFERHHHLVGEGVEMAASRKEAEERAESACRAWSREAAAVAALRDSLGADPQEIHDRLSEAERALVKAEQDLRRIQQAVHELNGSKAAAEARTRQADEDSLQARQELLRCAQVLHGRVSQPATAVALTSDPKAHDALLSVTASPGDIFSAVQAVKASLRTPDSTADATALIRAQSMLERNTAGAFDVIVTVDEGFHVVEVADATGRQHVAQAALSLKERRDRGRNALTQRERTAFHNFVLGGMAQELRSRIGEARKLVSGMDSSLDSISTSHGIGVNIRWRLADGANERVQRVLELLKRDVVMLKDRESEELIDLLKNLVDDEYAASPEAGYAAHLRTALDYRVWHAMDIIITGPNPGQERKISRRAKLSQGETRFVSYVTLFAAADAFLSSLPDAGRALRLILLDDAFAKVDHATVGELMALLVRLDLDFVMTGHALWGFYPEVPAIDAYEVRRAEGTAAITTHVHWDGHTRHLRAA